MSLQMTVLTVYVFLYGRTYLVWIWNTSISSSSLPSCIDLIFLYNVDLYLAFPTFSGTFWAWRSSFKTGRDQWKYRSRCSAQRSVFGADRCFHCSANDYGFHSGARAAEGWRIPLNFFSLGVSSNIKEWTLHFASSIWHLSLDDIVFLPLCVTSA